MNSRKVLKYSANVVEICPVSFKIAVILNLFIPKHASKRILLHLNSDFKQTVLLTKISFLHPLIYHLKLLKFPFNFRLLLSKNSIFSCHPILLLIKIFQAIKFTKIKPAFPNNPTMLYTLKKIKFVSFSTPTQLK